MRFGGFLLPFFVIGCQVLELRGDAFQHFGNAAVVQSIVDKLPDIAKEIAAPLAKTDKVSDTPAIPATNPCVGLAGHV